MLDGTPGCLAGNDDGSVLLCYLGFLQRSGDTEETMARRSIAERLAQLEAQRKSLQTKLGKQERARDTRRKILLGALVLHRLEKGQDAFSKEHLPHWLRRELPGFITRDDDAALFSDLIGESGAVPLPDKT